MAAGAATGARTGRGRGGLTDGRGSVPRTRSLPWLGGSPHYEVDREAGDQIEEISPGLVDVALTSRHFLGRAARGRPGHAVASGPGRP
ncbi:SAM-dependent methyltransferase, partial [Streptomyces sp. NPDC056937]|uniref:SAM-dependent methyltransferase n=1 Tax=Streptomyces sp. NPDC056937 TaxID=3345969 RepID=UPI00362E3657